MIYMLIVCSLLLTNVSDPMGKKNDEILVQEWIEALKSKDKQRRWEAAHVLWLMAQEKRTAVVTAVPALAKALGDEDFAVRKRAYDALEEIGKPAVPELIKALADNKAVVQCNAADLLVPLLWKDNEGRKKLINLVYPTVLKLFLDSNKEVRSQKVSAVEGTSIREQAGMTLTCIGYSLGPRGKEEVVSIMLKVLNSEEQDKDVLYVAMAALGKLGPESKVAISALLKRLDDKAYILRIGAIRGLSSFALEVPEVLPAIIKVLEKENRYTVVETVIDEVEKIGPKAQQMALTALPPLLKHKDMMVRIEAARGLNKLLPGNLAGVPIMIPLLSYGDAKAEKEFQKTRKDLWYPASPMEIRFYAAEALNTIQSGNPAAVATLIDLLSLGDERVRGWAISTLRKIGPAAKPAIPALLKALEDSCKNVREEALYNLKALQMEIPALTVLLKHKDMQVRIEAAQNLKNQDAVKTLIPLLSYGEAKKHNDMQIRKDAAFALTRIQPGNQAAVSTLIDLLSLDDETMRCQAINVLRDNGPGAKAAIPALLKARKDKNKEVSVYAAQALCAI